MDTRIEVPGVDVMVVDLEDVSILEVGSCRSTPFGGIVVDVKVGE